MTGNWRATLAVSAAIAGLTLGTGGPASRAQVRSAYDLGALGLGQSLQRLQTTASAMHTGAHPDDEDSALLARLARGDHARVAYLAFNRGEGGQNIIGRELFDQLGVIRTEELLQARRIDGADQLFTRTVDFGFSKTREEAGRVWGEEAVLDDMVRAIRTFRPLVVISRFSGTPNDGHGHHQLAGYLTPVAVARAADPAAFPEHRAEGLRPWRVLKVYVGEGFRPSTDGGPALRVETGGVDPLLGRSYFELAMEGRSLHRSQRQGALELRGPRASVLRLLSSAEPSSPEALVAPMFSGIDTSIAGIPSLAGAPATALVAELASAQAAAAHALASFQPMTPHTTLPSILEGLEAIRRARGRLEALGLDPGIRAEIDFRLDAKEEDFVDAAVRAAGVVVDPLADRETVVPGESATVSVRTFIAMPAGSAVPAQNISARVVAAQEWRVESSAPAAAAPGGRGRGAPETARHEATFRVTVPSGAKATGPYWLASARGGRALFSWPDGAPKGRPFGRPVMEAEVDVALGTSAIKVRRPVEFRVADPIRGELRRRVDVVPALSVIVDTPLAIVPASNEPSHRNIVVQAENLSRASIQGRLRVRVPAGWSISPADAPFSIARPGERASARFTVTIPPTARVGRYNLDATASANGIDYASTVTAIAYPHIQTHRLSSGVTTEVQVLELRTPAVKVGYISGTGDEVASAIRLMGLAVTPLDADMLASGDLSQFNTIVVGIRAAEVRPDFVANHRRLMEFVEGGGALVVQYQPPEYAEQGLPPFPAEVGTRITDETADVTLLQPGHPVFTTPNRIVASDWAGWVQERSVNSWAAFDPRYTPLVEASDPGEPAQRGGQLLAEVGRGVYVYTSYAWFRQLPAGVPGAYRLFANILALGSPDRR